jgi:hypothetical protein
VLKHLLVALAMTAVTVAIHGAGMLAALSVFGGRRDEAVGPPSRLRVVSLVFGLVGFLLLLHLAEAGAWAVCYRVAGMFPDFETAAYFSLTSYTTVGYGDVVSPQPWRLLGPIEAGVGILMFGWSTAIIVALLERILFGRRIAPRFDREGSR